MSRALPLVLAAVITTGITGAALLPASTSTKGDSSPVVALADIAPSTVVPTDWTTAGMAAGSALARQTAARKAAATSAAKAVADARARAYLAARASRSRFRAASYGSPRSIARAMLAERGWSDQFGCLDSLWTRESGWRVYASNPSGAYGIPQALPGSKMASSGSDWRTNPATQIRWGLGYIAASYGSPCGAWRHSQSYNWY